MGGGGVLIPFPKLFRPNPSPKCEIERKSQSRWFIFVMTLKTHFSLETVLPCTGFHIYHNPFYSTITQNRQSSCVQVDHWIRNSRKNNLIEP